MKYCDDCIHFIKKTFQCKAFGFTTFQKINKKIKIEYYRIDYLRSQSYLCGVNANLHMDKKLFQNNNLNKRLK